MVTRLAVNQVVPRGLDARYLRRTSSGDLSLLDTAVDVSGDISKAAANTAAVNQLLADIKGAGGGILRLGRCKTFLSPLETVSNCDIEIDGSGRRAANIYALGTGGLFNISQSSQGYRTTMRGFSAIKWNDATATEAAINIDYPDVLSSLTDTVICDDLEGRGVNGTTSFASLVTLRNVWNAKASRLEFEGIVNTPSATVGALAFRGKCTVAQVHDVKAFWTGAAVDYEGGFFSEGGRFSYLHAVATDYLLRNPNGIDAPGLYVSQSHGETYKGGIYTRNLNQLQLADVHLYKRIASTDNWTGVYLDAFGGYGAVGLTANGLLIHGFKSLDAGGTSVGVFCAGVDGIAGAGNIIIDCDLGFDGGAPASSGQFAFTHFNTTTPSQNDGSMTITATSG